MPKLIEAVRTGGVGRRAILELIDELNYERAARGVRHRYAPAMRDGELTMKEVSLSHRAPNNARSRTYADDIEAIAAQ